MIKDNDIHFVEDNMIKDNDIHFVEETSKESQYYLNPERTFPNIQKREEVSYLISKDCIDTIKEISQYLDVTESDALEYCIRCPEKFNILLKRIAEKRTIKGQLERYNLRLAGKSLSDDLFLYKGDMACKVGGCKWKDDDINNEIKKDDNVIEASVE